jgi:hypothetical protein
MILFDKYDINMVESDLYIFPNFFTIQFINQESLSFNLGMSNREHSVKHNEDDDEDSFFFEKKSEDQD